MHNTIYVALNKDKNSIPLPSGIPLPTTVTSIIYRDNATLVRRDEIFGRFENSNLNKELPRGIYTVPANILV